MNLRNLIFFEKEWLPYLTYQTKLFNLPLKNVDTIIKNLGVCLKCIFYYQKSYHLGQGEEVLLKQFQHCIWPFPAGFLGCATEDNPGTLV